MKQYLSFIRKADFIDLFKYGFLYVNRDTTKDFECNVEELPDRLDIFETLVKNANSFDSSFVYLIIHYEKDEKDEPYFVRIEELRHLYPLDKEAKSEFESSFDGRIRVEEPIWADAVFELQKKRAFNECRKGAENVLKIFEIEEYKTNCERIFTDDILKEVVSETFNDCRPQEDISIWVYLLRYERHSSYPKDKFFGFLFDVCNVVCNKLGGKEVTEDEISETKTYKYIQGKYEQSLRDSHMMESFSKFYPELERECKGFIDKVKSLVSGDVDFLKIAFWFMYLKEYNENGFVYNPKSVENAKHKIGEEFSYAAYLLGLRLGHEYTYDCLYEKLPLAIFRDKKNERQETEFSSMASDYYSIETNLSDNVGEANVVIDANAARSIDENKKSDNSTNDADRATPSSKSSKNGEESAHNVKKKNVGNIGQKSKRKKATISDTKDSVGKNEGSRKKSTPRIPNEYPAKMIKIGRNGKPSKSTKSVNNQKEFLKYHDEGYVLESEVNESQQELFSENK